MLELPIAAKVLLAPRHQEMLLEDLQPRRWAGILYSLTWRPGRACASKSLGHVYIAPALEEVT